MSGKSEEKAKKMGLKNVDYIDYSNNPKKNFPGGLSIAPPPQKLLPREEKSISKFEGVKKRNRTYVIV